MCNQRTEKWVCKYCEKPVKEVTYLTSKCESKSDTGVCKEAGKTYYETIDMYTFNYSFQYIIKILRLKPFSMCQTIETTWACATCSKTILEKKSKKNVCESFNKNGICTQASPTLLDYVYVTDADCEICKQMN
ncbi:hypothetical protein FCULG_00007722 [Fusarium culmorum]|uniref:Uncharacterized protein n=1 Tax=Fusarium culmorum TaxID=5516 RepID=A0A2T4H4I5_FUSCU|nr:hypothetical protein FCULG_00007722 [Fusarium culmorum]